MSTADLNPAGPESAQGRIHAAMNRASALGREHFGLILVVGLTFLMRVLLSTQSYWYDEFLSVVIYGTDHRTAWDAVVFLANESIHPPLYQFILHVWMDLFGDDEVVTRALSGLYVAGATVSLYALVLPTHGKRFALTAALIFSLLFIPFYYGMETRSYAQTLFLVSVSSLALSRFIAALPHNPSGRQLVLTGWFAVIVLASAGALLTHYYNVFFVAAQGGFFLLWYLVRNGLSLRHIIKSTIVGIAPLILFLLIWGVVLVQSYTRNSDRYALESLPTRAPWDILYELVVVQNFGEQPALGLALLILGVVICAVSAVALLRRVGGQRDVLNLYMLTWVLVPPVLAYVLFAISGHERYSARYFMFCTPPLALLVTLVLFEPFRALQRFVPSVRAALPLAPIGIVAFIIVAIMPETYRAATETKHDHRGMAEEVVDIVEENPGQSYIVFDVSNRPVLGYYLNQMRPRVPVTGQITRSQESAGVYITDEMEAEIAEHDYLLVVFTHDRRRSFPNLITHLEERYTLQQSLQNHMGRGILIFEI